jgi:hypothetical protein
VAICLSLPQRTGRESLALDGVQGGGLLDQRESTKLRMLGKKPRPQGSELIQREPFDLRLRPNFDLLSRPAKSDVAAPQTHG